MDVLGSLRLVARPPAALLGILLRGKRDSEQLCAGTAGSGCGVDELGLAERERLEKGREGAQCEGCWVEGVCKAAADGLLVHVHIT